VWYSFKTFPETLYSGSVENIFLFMGFCSYSYYKNYFIKSGRKVKKLPSKVQKHVERERGRSSVSSVDYQRSAGCEAHDSNLVHDRRLMEMAI
jgi:hypothetical protein